MIDILKLYPNAVKVDPKTIKTGDRVAIIRTEFEVDSLDTFEVMEYCGTENYIVAPTGKAYPHEDLTVYKIPPKLPTEPGSIIRNVVTTGGPDPYVSGTLLSDGRWYLVDVSGIAGPLGAHHIASFEVV